MANFLGVRVGSNEGGLRLNGATQEGALDASTEFEYRVARDWATRLGPDFPSRIETPTCRRASAYVGKLSPALQGRGD